MRVRRIFAELLVFGAIAATPAAGAVKTGLDVLVEQKLAPLAGKHVGVITNHSGVTRDGRSIIDVLSKSDNVRLMAIFTPEHGLDGSAMGANVTAKETNTGIPIYSLYGRGVRGPTAEMLRGIDALVYDIQDVGVRFYTYITTLGYSMESAAKASIPIYVLDRPNPINGTDVEGPLLDDKYVSFVAYMRMPIRHGMTMGELAQMYNGEKKLGADLHVIQMEGWERRMWYEETGLPWINPSPNLRNLLQTTLYPGSCLLESRQISVGRGTEMPFQVVGAPWFRAREVAEYLNNTRKVPGVRFVPRRFRPTASVYKDQDCQGLEIMLIDRKEFRPVLMGLELLSAVLKFHPDQFDLQTVMRLLGNDDAGAHLKRGDTGAAVAESYQTGLDGFRKMRQQYLIYK